jgi:membrane protein YdbS with pleckstrin-like domain
MSEKNTDHGHGDSVAAWVAVIVILIAFSAGTFAFWLDQAAWVWASAGLAVIGLVLGLVLKAAGYGVGGSKSKSNH